MCIAVCGTRLLRAAPSLPDNGQGKGWGLAAEMGCGVGLCAWGGAGPVGYELLRLHLMMGGGEVWAV